MCGALTIPLTGFRFTLGRGIAQRGTPCRIRRPTFRATFRQTVRRSIGAGARRGTRG